MSGSAFPCPHCSAPLRIKDRALRGRKVDCPDCGEPIVLDINNKREIIGKLPETPQRRQKRLSKKNPGSKSGRSKPSAQNASESSAKSVPRSQRKTRPTPVEQSRLKRILTNPVGIAWTVTTVAALAIGAYVWSSGRTSNEPRRIAAVEDELHDNGVAENLDDDVDEVVVSEEQVLQDRMADLGNRVLGFQQQQQRFPAIPGAAEGVPLASRFSWMAELVANSSGEGKNAPVWDRPWNDPLNDSFVRQAIPEFQNPQIKQLVGPFGYPATHFVGVSGLGDDAARLPASHPRAGVFGIGRQTHVDDIKDGLSNTIMIAGVTQNIGSWAAAGEATIRSFRQEPYINGPDGFGTGDSDGMWVVMADGSVRFLSEKTDPLIVRRMVAMADGLPLDATVAGEPGQGSTDASPMVVESDAEPSAEVETAKPAVPEMPRVEPLPAQADASGTDVGSDEPVAATPPDPLELARIDLRTALRQKIVSFELSSPTPAEELLFQLEEMVGKPFVYDEPEMSRDDLKKRVTVKLQNTTVGGILSAVVEQVGLQYDIENEEIRIRKRDPPSS